MNTFIKLKRGLKSNLPSEGLTGEPFICTDTRELYVGNGLGNPLIKIAGGLYSNIEFSNFNKTSTQSISSGSVTLVTWNPQSDIHGFWNSSQNNRITIPSGITKVRLSCLLNVDDLREVRIHYIQLLLNGSVIEEHEYGWENSSRDRYLKIVSRILDVSTSDYLQIRLYQNSGSSRNILTSNTYLQVEVLG